MGDMDEYRRTGLRRTRLLPWVVVGVVVVEFVFTYPGMGKLMVDAVRKIWKVE